MFGGDISNLLSPVSMDNVRLPYNGSGFPPMQLDALIGYNTDTMNIGADKNASLANYSVKLGVEMPVIGQHKLPPMTPYDNICLQEAGKVTSILKQIPVSTGLRLSYGEEDHNSSISSAGEGTMFNRASLLPQDNLKTELVRQNMELDQYLRMQEESMRKGIRALQQRHAMALLTALDKEVSNRLHEKDVAIDNLIRKNKELTEKIRQITAETQSWIYKAKQNESLVHVLKNNIDQVLLQNAACLKEGCGQSTGDDAVSSSNQNHVDNSFVNLEQMPSLKCKACKGKEVCVLLLPCRHLCLCIECDVFIDVCPLCRSKKTGSLQVYMP